MTKSRRILVALAGLYGAVGAVVPHVAHSSDDAAAINFALGFPTAIALFSWCKSDAAERAVVAPAPSALLIGVVAPIGVPYYLFHTREFWAALWGVLKASGYLVVLNLVFAGAARLSQLVV
jgi:hypothetical protein